MSLPNIRVSIVGNRRPSPMLGLLLAHAALSAPREPHQRILVCDDAVLPSRRIARELRPLSDEPLDVALTAHDHAAIAAAQAKRARKAAKKISP